MEYVIKILHCGTKFQYARSVDAAELPIMVRASILDRDAYAPDQFARIVQVFGCDLEHPVAHLCQEALARFWMSSPVRLREIDDYTRFSAEIVHDERADSALPNEGVTPERLTSE
jgi:hypothetical protein